MTDRAIEEHSLLLLWSALRQTFSPELSSALAKDRAKRADAALLRLVAGYGQLPAVRRSYQVRYEDLLVQAQALAAAAAAPAHLAASLRDNPLFVGVPGPALGLEAILLRLQSSLRKGDAAGAGVDSLILKVAQLEADMRAQFELAVGQVKPVTAATARPVTQRALEDYLRGHSRGSPGIRVQKVVDVPGGRSKRTILVSLQESRALPGEIVLRMDTDRGVGTSVTGEFPLLERVARNGLPVPEPLWLESDRSFFGFPFIVFRRMPGESAGDLIEGAFKKEPATGYTLARVLAAIHSGGAELIDDPPLRGSVIPHTRSLLDHYYAHWTAKKPLPSLVIEAAFLWMRRHLEQASGEATVVHGDTGFHNLLMDAHGNACLLDWEFAHLGDAAEDLASCRPAVQQVMPWADFLAAYHQHGGQAVSEFRLNYFEIWRPLRNAVVCGTVLHSLMNGEADDIDPVTIGLSTFVRLQSDLARSLARIAAGTSGD